MNCPFKKTHLRLLSLTLVLLMVVGMFAGCGKTKDTETTPSTEDNLPPGLVEVKPTATTTPPTEETKPVDKNAAVINADDTPIRQTPSNDAEPIAHLKKGTTVTIIREVSIAEVGWSLIREGWVKSEALDKSYVPDDTTNQDDDPPAETKPGETTTTNSYTGYITASDLNIRREGRSDAARVGSYEKGTKVTILETKNGWGRTDKGWISLDYVSKNAVDTNTDSNTTTNNGKGTPAVVTATDLNIRKEANQNSDRLGSYNFGSRITILETKNGWGRTDKGWISLNYVYQDGAQGNNGCNGVVIATQLNVRSGPGTNYDKVNALNFGARVNVLERITLNGTTWGYANGGWISMEHVYVDGTKGQGAGEGTCTGDAVNIRSGPGTNYGSVGSANKGDAITILFQIKLGNTTWGYVNKGNTKGWMSMQYANMG